MKKNLHKMLAATVLAGSMFAAAPASAVVVFLSAPPVAVPAGWEFTYQGNFSAGEGVKTGSSLVIFDFDGYIPGTIFSPFADVSAVAELTSGGVPTNPEFTDDPGRYNLRFTYTGAATLDLSNTSFAGLKAVSSFGGMTSDGFGAMTTKTSGMLLGSNVYSSGQVTVPGGVPEPAAWGMMLFGFGLTGAAMRRRRMQPRMVTA